MNNFSDYINKNKKSWYKRTLIHLKSNFYDNNKFKKHLNSLNSIELEEIGNVKKKDLVYVLYYLNIKPVRFMLYSML